MNDHERIERLAFIDTAFEDMLKILDSCIDRTRLSHELNVWIDAANERRAALKESINQWEKDELERLYDLNPLESQAPPEWN